MRTVRKLDLKSVTPQAQLFGLVVLRVGRELPLESSGLLVVSVFLGHPLRCVGWWPGVGPATGKQIVEAEAALVICILKEGCHCLFSSLTKGTRRIQSGYTLKL